MKEHGTELGQENQGAKVEHLECCGCHTMGTLHAGAARNEIRIGASLCLHLNNFFLSSFAMGFPLHLDQTVSGAFWQWVLQSQHPQVGAKSIMLELSPAPALSGGGTGHGGINARWLLGCATQPQHPHHHPGLWSRGRRTIREGLLVLIPILLTCLST